MGFMSIIVAEAKCRSFGMCIVKLSDVPIRNDMITS